MSIQQTDIKFFGSAAMPEDDTLLNIGGAIDVATQIVFTDLDANGLVEMLSTSAGDNQTVTIYGRNAAGEPVSEAQALNGTTVVDFTTTFAKINKITLSAAAAGTVTVRKDGAAGDLAVIEAGVTTVRKIFIGAAVPVAGSVDFYEKVFVKNTHGTLSLTSGQILEQADPSGKVAFGLPATIDDSGTNGAGNNHQVPPGGITFDNADKNVANGQILPAGSAQGVWLKLTLASADAAADTTYTLRCSGLSAA